MPCWKKAHVRSDLRNKKYSFLNLIYHIISQMEKCSVCLSEAKLIPIHDDKHSICEKCGTECFPSGEFKIQNCPFCRMELKTDEKNPFSVSRQQHMSRSIGFLKDLTGHYHTFHYCHSTTLNQLQTWIEDLFGTPRKLQRLIFRGQSPPENLGTVLLPQETINLFQWEVQNSTKR